MLHAGKAAASAAACVVLLWLACPAVALASASPVAIHQIQGPGLVSPLQGTQVSTEGVVTELVANGFYLQTAAGGEDADPATSQGLFVHDAAASTRGLASGHLVRVTGTVREHVPDGNPHQLTLTRLEDITSVVVLGQGQALPAPVTLGTADLDPARTIEWMERYEGMRARVERLKVTQPIGGEQDPATGIGVADGVFFGVLPGVPRPMREPGIAVADAFPIPEGKDIPVFDMNPESLRIDALGLGTSAPTPDLGDEVLGLAGVMDYRQASPTLLLSPGSAPTVNRLSYAYGVGGALYEEVSLATFNLGRFYDDHDDTTRPDLVWSTQAFQNRLDKTANVLCHRADRPKILAVFEVENADALDRLANAVNTNHYACYGSRNYAAYLLEGPDFLGLDLGLMVSELVLADGRKEVEVLDLEQLASQATFQHPSGDHEALFSRPPLLAPLRINHESGGSAELTVVVAEVSSASGVNSLEPGPLGWTTLGDYVRKKRAAQALWIATFIEARQAADPEEKLVLLGNFNTHTSSDGYVDVMGIVTGREAGSTQVVEYVDSPISRPLTNLSTRTRFPEETSNEPESSNTSILQGNTRRLEHIVFNEAALEAFSFRWIVPSFNAGFGVDLADDPTLLVHSSAYEPTVAFITTDLFRSVDLQMLALPEAAQWVEDSPGLYIASSLVTNTLKFYVLNNGMSAADAISMEIRSSLAPGQWALASYSQFEGVPCDPVTAIPEGSVLRCTMERMGGSSGLDLYVEIPPSPDLDGVEARFDYSIGHAGPGAERNPEDNAGQLRLQLKSTADLTLETLVFENPVNAGSSASVTHIVRNSSVNRAGRVVLAIVANAQPSEAYMSAQNTAWQCDAGVAQPEGKTRWTCINPDFNPSAEGDYISFSTHPDTGNGGKAFRVEATATSETVDERPENNQTDVTVSVRDDTFFRVTADVLEQGQIRLNQQALFMFKVWNSPPSISRNARVEIIIDAPPADLSTANGTSYYYQTNHFPPAWTCSDAQAHESGKSRILCSSVPANLPAPSINFDGWSFWVRVQPRPVANQPTSTINGTIRVYSDSVEGDPSDDVGSVQQVVNQSTDLVIGSIVYNGVGTSVEVVEPESMTFHLQASFDLFNPQNNIPLNVRIHHQLDALVDAADVSVTRGMATRVPMACVVTPDPGAGTTRIDCPETVSIGSEFVAVKVRTRAAMHGRTVSLASTASNDLYDRNPGNNVLIAGVRVIGRANLCLSPNASSSDPGNCGPVDYVLPTRIVAGDRQLFTMNYRNLGPSVARNARARIRAGIAASRLSARWGGDADCGPAQALADELSEVLCQFGDVPANTRFGIEFWLDTAGFVEGGSISYSLALETVTEDTAPGNNAYSASLPIVPVVDLSSRVSVKFGGGSNYTSAQDFYVSAGAEGPETSSASRMNLQVAAPGARTHARLTATGWSCQRTGSAAAASYACTRNRPLPAGLEDRLVLSFQPVVQQAGKTITVTSNHYFPPSALAVDRNDGNNSASAVRSITRLTGPGGISGAVSPQVVRPGTGRLRD